MKVQERIAGLGRYELRMEWHPMSYDPASGNGVSEYYFYFDDGMPVAFPEKIRQSTSRIVHLKPTSDMLIVAIQGAGHVDNMFEKGSDFGHYCGYNYSPGRYMGDDAPFLFGRDDEEFMEWQHINIELTSEEFAGETDIANSITEEITDQIGSIENEHESALVRLTYESFDETVRIMNTPDRGYVGGVLLGDRYFADDIYFGNSVLDVVENTLESAINSMATFMQTLRDEGLV